MPFRITSLEGGLKAINDWIAAQETRVAQLGKQLQGVLTDRRDGICRTSWVPDEPIAKTQSLGTNSRRWDAYLRNVNVNGTLTYPAGSLGLVLTAGGAAFNPADTLVYYTGSMFSAAPTTTAAQARIYIPRTGTIERVDVEFFQTAGSNETSTIALRLNNTTDTTISAAVTNDAAFTHFAATGLSVAVVAGDYCELKWTAPTWGTNPTAVVIGAQIYIH